MNKNPKCKGCGQFLGKGSHDCPKGIVEALKMNPLLGELADGQIFNQIAEELRQPDVPIVATSATVIPRHARVRKMHDPDT